MSERMTSIDLPGLHLGFADYGRREPKEMIARLRVMAAEQKQEAEAVLNAADDDFRIQTYVGIHVRRKRETIQEGKP